MVNKYQKFKNQTKISASENIRNLFKQAENNPKYANRYVSLARKISSRHKAKIPLEFKRRFCKGCGNYFSSKSLRVRLNKGKKTYSCIKCGKITRVPYKP